MSAAARALRTRAAARWALWKRNDDILVQDFCTMGLVCVIFLASTPAFGG